MGNKQGFEGVVERRSRATDRTRRSVPRRIIESAPLCGGGGITYRSGALAAKRASGTSVSSTGGRYVRRCAGTTARSSGPGTWRSG